jgi:hypothetical protein
MLHFASTADLLHNETTLLHSYEIYFILSPAVEVPVVVVLQLTEIVNQTGIETEIEIVFPVGGIGSTLGLDVGLNRLCVIQHGTKIQVKCFSQT